MTTTTEDKRQAIARAQLRATAKAKLLAEQGHRPILMTCLSLPEHSQTEWVVFSKSAPETGYVVTGVVDWDSTIHTICECQAAHAARPCWHRALVRLAITGACPHLDGRAAVQQSRPDQEESA